MSRIEVCVKEWFYSKKADKIYRYNIGNFEAYPNEAGDTFYSHHTLKVLPPDAVVAVVTRLDNGKYRLVQSYEWYKKEDKLYNTTGKGIIIYSLTPRGTYRKGSAIILYHTML